MLIFYLVLVWGISGSYDMEFLIKLYDTDSRSCWTAQVNTGTLIYNLLSVLWAICNNTLIDLFIEV